jgi:hypothetical protein
VSRDSEDREAEGREEQSFSLRDIEVDRDNLYREEMVTDLRVATLRILVPIKPDGSTDASRETIYMGQTQLMSQMGPLPVNARIEAASLDDAMKKFPEAMQEAVERMIDEAREIQRQEASRIVVPQPHLPGSGGGGGGGMPGGGGGKIILG